MVSFSTVPTYLLNLQNRRMVANQQFEMQKLGKEIGSGLKADVYGDLGMRSAITIKARGMMDEAKEYKLSNELLGNRMEVMADVMGTVRETTDDFLAMAVQNATNKGVSASEMQSIAKARITDVVQAMNSVYEGQFLFSGVHSDNQTLYGLNETSPSSGMTPLQAMQSVLGGPPTSAADANAKIADVDAMFDNTFADPTKNFEGAFYGGAPELDGGGNPLPRVEARPDATTVLDYGVQANDEGFKRIIKGMYMLASVDAMAINDQQAYETYIGKAVEYMATGSSMIGDYEAKLGTQQQLVDRVVEKNAARITVLNKKLLDMEAVDPYEAQARLTSLETQIHATYNVSARMAKLSFGDYMR